MLVLSTERVHNVDRYSRQIDGNHAHEQDRDVDWEMCCVGIPVGNDNGRSDNLDGSSHCSLEPKLPAHGEANTRVDVSGSELDETSG